MNMDSEDTTAISVTGRTWCDRPYRVQDTLAIAQALGLPEMVARIITSRGILPSEAEAFLQPTLRNFMPDPLHLKDMEKAARRIVESYHLKTKIAIFGDYDVDGATSSALLVRYFRALGLEVLVHIPDRMKEGYGPNTPALLALKAAGADLVITVDCGTLAFEPLRSAQSAQLDVIVIDHHKGDVEMPPCYALVNPNRADETSPHGQLAACGVTFLLLVAVGKFLRESGVTPPDLIPLLDIVALGTICDVVPLTGINRAFVAQGLKVMQQRGNMGIKAVQDSAAITEIANTYHAGYIIGPRINAGGRVGRSDLGTRLLATEDEAEAFDIAKELNQFNAERKAIESLVQEEAMQDALALPESDAVIVVGRDNWHAGVIGIVAGRLKEHFHKPVAVIALEHGVGKASARSIPGVDLGAAVIAATHSGHLIKGGGHMMAAGFTVEEAKIEDLRAFFNATLGVQVAKLAKEKQLHIDGVVSIEGVTCELVRLLDKAAPFGAGNPSIRLKITHLRVVRADKVGVDHVRVILSDAGTGATSVSLKAMAFRSLNTPLGEVLLHSRGCILAIAGQAKINHWQGRETVDFMIDDVMVSA